jgi:hypothetical protein
LVILAGFCLFWKIFLTQSLTQLFAETKENFLKEVSYKGSANVADQDVAFACTGPFLKGDYFNDRGRLTVLNDAFFNTERFSHLTKKYL